MCTLIIWQNCWEELPLLVASNRDENVHRPSEGPRIKGQNQCKMFSPTDLKAGGTWLGINEAGVFSAITNRFGIPPDPQRRSRGELVSLALEGETGRAGLEKVKGLTARDFNPFHLAICDRTAGVILWSDGENFHEQPIAKGPTVVTERSFSTHDSQRQSRLDEYVRGTLQSGSAPSDSQLESLLKGHDEIGFEGVCVHVPHLGYATRSSTIIRFAKELHEVSYRWADGPPCETAYDRIEVDWGVDAQNCK